MNRLRPAALAIAVAGVALLILGSPVRSETTSVARGPARFASALVLSAGELATLTPPASPSAAPNAAHQTTAVAVRLLAAVVGAVIVSTARLAQRGRDREHAARAPPVLRFG